MAVCSQMYKYLSSYSTTAESFNDVVWQHKLQIPILCVCLRYDNVAAPLGCLHHLGVSFQWNPNGRSVQLWGIYQAFSSSFPLSWTPLGPGLIPKALQFPHNDIRPHVALVKLYLYITTTTISIATHTHTHTHTHRQEFLLLAQDTVEIDLNVRCWDLQHCLETPEICKILGLPPPQT